MNKQDIYWIDLFCGGGGTSTGIHLASKRNKIIACVNHDKNAIQSHQMNHPKTVHFTEDIKDFKVVQKIKVLVDKILKKNPNAQFNLWASLECTNFSIAKGGLSRDADSRSLAEHMFMYLKELPIHSFYVENVKEFLDWGPLDKNKKPIKSLKGIYYKRWIHEVKRLGYDCEYKILNSADYGSCQARKRLFIIFPKVGTPAYWPKETHNSDGSGGLLKHRAVKEVLNLNDLGVSIFSKKRSDKTYERIFKGLLKQHSEFFMTSYYGNGYDLSINKPCGTITTKDRFALHHITYDYGNATSSSINKPCSTVLTTPKQNLCSIHWLMDTQYNRVGMSINKPSPTIIARQDKKPLYKLHANYAKPNISINSDDSEIVVKIKNFMIQNNIFDITIRMLSIQELLQIQGFPITYKLVGTIAEKKKYIGNAVDVFAAKALISAIP